MARITIDRLNRPEEEQLTGAQAGKVVGAGLTIYNPYTGIVTYTGMGPALGPFSWGYGYRPPVFGYMAPIQPYAVAPIYPVAPAVNYYGW